MIVDIEKIEKNIIDKHIKSTFKIYNKKYIKFCDYIEYEKFININKFNLLFIFKEYIL